MNGWDGSNDGIILGGAGAVFACYTSATDFGYSHDGVSYSGKAHGVLTGLHHVVITRDNTAITWYVDGAPSAPIRSRTIPR